TGNRRYRISIDAAKVASLLKSLSRTLAVGSGQARCRVRASLFPLGFGATDLPAKCRIHGSRRCEHRRDVRSQDDHLRPPRKSGGVLSAHAAGKVVLPAKSVCAAPPVSSRSHTSAALASSQL